jgi:hypothetical protein
MFQDPISSWNTVMQETDRLDQVREENVLDVVPEFKLFWNNNEKT